MLEAAKARLLAMVARAPPEALTPLLEASFAYIGLPGLRDVPLAVLGRMRPVPAAFLKQLATDAELFHDLPHSVQQEVCGVAIALALAAPAVIKAIPDRVTAYSTCRHLGIAQAQCCLLALGTTQSHLACLSQASCNSSAGCSEREPCCFKCTAAFTITI